MPSGFKGALSSDGMGASLLLPLLALHAWQSQIRGPSVNFEAETIMERTVIAIDITKKVFQLHWVEIDTGCIERLQLKRAKLLEWFVNRTAAVVMEACGGAHDWSRTLIGLDHEVRLISPRKVRPFVQRNKTDAADAQAIWTACQQPGMRFVPVKTEAQQIVQNQQFESVTVSNVPFTEFEQLRKSGFTHNFLTKHRDEHQAPNSLRRTS